MVEQQGAWHGPSRWSHGHNKTPNSYSIPKHRELHDNHRRKVAVLEIEGYYTHCMEMYGSYKETFTFIFFYIFMMKRAKKKCNNRYSLTLHGWNFCGITKVSNLFDSLRGGKQSDSWKKIQDLVRGDARAGLVLHWFERGSWKVWMGNYTSCCLKINDETSNERLKDAD